MMYPVLSKKIYDALFKVHKATGPGLLESAYKACLFYEFKELGLVAKTEVPIPVYYNQVKLECGYRADFLIENKILIELKSVEEIHPVHKAQLITYLKLKQIKLGFLVNFNTVQLKKGIFRFVV